MIRAAWEWQENEPASCWKLFWGTTRFYLPELNIVDAEDVVSYLSAIPIQPHYAARVCFCSGIYELRIGLFPFLSTIEESINVWSGSKVETEIALR